MICFELIIFFLDNILNFRRRKLKNLNSFTEIYPKKKIFFLKLRNSLMIRFWKLNNFGKKYFISKLTCMIALACRC